MITNSRSPFESPSQCLISWRQVVRRVRNVLIVGAVLGLLIDRVGEPLLRWEYRYRGSRAHPQILNATYVGLRGRVESDGLDGAGDCPLVLFVRPDPPLWRRVTDPFWPRTP
ncbi:hypothetical protein Mal64_35580 [Pseudobythopirellula maris]|uniref:Uncharacterized protein n=1 Tax=Pseudobythopirellula maris TaxID=2527991 RepID=A0A5C5ZH30_9BACT|nr:hypothetical protein [Pseudobythopirellula maris]TWT86729.1 hypothetical protein Mal64_35580 [Pseudobythopirellula maris]